MLRDYIGLMAPGILLIFSLLLLRNKYTFLSFLLVGTLLNNVVNILLKLIIKEPRPSTDKRIIEIGVSNGERISFDKFGMPSGHAQNCGFFTAFITLVLKNPVVTGLYIVISCISLYQRYLYNNHTILQLIVGFIIGLILGYIAYTIGEKYIVKQITAKKDDFFYG